MATQARGIILAVGTAGVAATGAILGAQFKASREEAAKIAARTAEAIPNTENVSAPISAKKSDSRSLIPQQIAALEMSRAQLMTQRRGLEQKLAALQERMKASEEKEARRDGAREIMEKK